MTYRLGVIGGGNMGLAIVRGALKAGVLEPPSVIVVEIDAARRSAIEPLGCTVSKHARDALAAEQILLAVKPQAFPEVAQSIARAQAGKIVISIMAGLTSGTIHAALGGAVRVVRAMPNVCCQIGLGMTAITLGAGAKSGDDALAQQLFQAIGKTVVVDESLMHAVTAVSGSGPAYVFLLAEAMQHAAIDLGIDNATAQLLVEQTIRGGGALLAESRQGAAALRQSVTSPKGTTAAALDVLAQRRFIDTVIEALTAARDRGIELDQT